MKRKEAVAIIQEEWKGEKDEAQSEKYLDRLIDLFEPEFDPLKTEDGEVAGTKREHLRRNVRVFYQNEHGGF
jgi:hypothetical protein